MKHAFTAAMLEILRRRFGGLTDDLFEKSPLLQYLNFKTRSANRGSKARGAFANHYALYVLVEDYINDPITNNRRNRPLPVRSGPLSLRRRTDHHRTLSM